MTIAEDTASLDSRASTSTDDPSATFGSGGSEPYAVALRDADSPVLFLHATHRGRLAGAPMDVARWNAAADSVDLSLLQSVRGPVLDIGCGPGRMVRAAAALGVEALGIDVSPTAIDIARESGLDVLLASVFDDIPAMGAWQTALLVDGNIGIGGDVSAMLARCRQLLAPDGEIVVEVDPRHDVDNTYTGRLVDTDGRESAPFPWAEVGFAALVRRAEPLGLAVRQSWELEGRAFCRLAASTA
ncbi:class I SAM-dependent methyltransferase [Marisediminicola sp. LYQ134]|uniref:class I SAM-dependent methyltransferase n=1 Tax=unclassified Marisediminicola TaxID=2618316 RepID=UPI003982F363